MKKKELIVALAVILLCSALSVSLTMAQCPRCDGTGEIVCPQCDGTGEIIVEEGAPCEHCSGSGTLEPNVIMKSRSTYLSEGKVFVQATYENIETINAYGRVTGEIEVGTNVYKATSPRTLLPANEVTQVYFSIGGISPADYSTLEAQQRFSTNISIEVEDVDCPYCDGTGLGLGILDCPSCGGTGFIECPECSGSGIEGGEQNTELDIGGIAYGLVAVVAVAGVIVAAFVMKKRGVKEEDLKRMSLNEFKEWVLKKMEGKASSQSDARMGIDGYTLDGQPVAIKQAEDVDRTAVENFAAAVGRRKAKKGTIVAFSFGNDAIRGKVRARMNYGFEIQMVTVRELTESRNMSL